MRRLRSVLTAQKRVQVLKPLNDDRYASTEIVSHPKRR